MPPAKSLAGSLSSLQGTQALDKRFFRGRGIHIHVLPEAEPPPEVVRELEQNISFLLDGVDGLTGAIADPL